MVSEFIGELIGWSSLVIVLGVITIAWVKATLSDDDDDRTNPLSIKLLNITAGVGMVWLWYWLIINAPFTLI